MLMSEVASAADTLELWKMVNDSVWASLQHIQKQEAERKAAQRRTAAKAVPRNTRTAPSRAAPPAVPQSQQPVQQPQAAQSAATVSGDGQQRLGLQQPKPVAKDSDKSLG